MTLIDQFRIYLYRCKTSNGNDAVLYNGISRPVLCRSDTRIFSGGSSEKMQKMTSHFPTDFGITKWRAPCPFSLHSLHRV